MDSPLKEVQNTITLPVYTAPKHRPGFLNPGGNPQTWEQAYINCWPCVGKDTVSGEPSVSTVKRPGLKAGPVVAATIGSLGTINNMDCRANISISALSDVFVGAWWDSTASKIYIVQYRPAAGTSVKIGEITSATATDIIFLSEITHQVGGTYPAGTSTPAVAVSYQKGDLTLGAGYFAVSASGVFTVASLTAISSASFPSNLATVKQIIGPFQQMNGISYIMTTEGTIYGSGGSAGDIYDIVDWNTNTISVASMYPDKGLGVWRYKSHLVAFGSNSVEFFVDAGLPPPASPLERMDQAFIKFGALSQVLVKNVDDTIYWLAYGSDGAFGVWQLDGYTPRKISDHKVDTALAVNGTTTPGPQNTMEVVVLHYERHLMINWGTYRNTGAYGTTIFNVDDDADISGSVDCSAAQIMYNIDAKQWWGMSIADGTTTVGLMPAQSFTVGSTGVATNYIFLSKHASAVPTGTLLYYFDNVAAGDAAYVDALTSANAVCASVQFNTYWFGTSKRKRINRATVLTNRVIQPGSDANVYKIYICYTRDDTNVTLGPQFARASTIPIDANRYYINNLGKCRNISFLVVSKSKNSFNCYGLELDIDQGT